MEKQNDDIPLGTFFAHFMELEEAKQAVSKQELLKKLDASPGLMNKVSVIYGLSRVIGEVEENQQDGLCYSDFQLELTLSQEIVDELGINHDEAAENGLPTCGEEFIAKINTHLEICRTCSEKISVMRARVAKFADEFREDPEGAWDKV